MHTTLLILGLLACPLGMAGERLYKELRYRALGRYQRFEHRCEQ
jgi:hypothetical protein